MKPLQNTLKNPAVGIRNSTDFSPFGVELKGRNFEVVGAGNYRFGFQGQESDSEIKGEGNSYDFGARIYDSRIARWASPDNYESQTPSWTPYRICYNNPIYWIDNDGNKEFPSYKAYTKYAQKNKIEVRSIDDMWKDGNWLTYHRKAYLNNGINSELGKNYRKANYMNTMSLNSDEYLTVEDRMDFYKWADDYSERLGNEVMWMQAGYMTVTNLLLLTLPETSSFGMSNNEIVQFVNGGNKAILDDMMPKLKDLLQDKRQIKGNDALKWDAQALADEQVLIIQKFYDGLSKKSLDILQKNIEKDGFKGDILNPQDRWAYGMKKMGYNVKKEDMPSAGGCWESIEIVEKKQ